MNENTNIIIRCQICGKEMETTTTNIYPGTSTQDTTIIITPCCPQENTQTHIDCCTDAIDDYDTEEICDVARDALKKIEEELKKDKPDTIEILMQVNGVQEDINALDVAAGDIATQVELLRTEHKF